MSKGNKQIVRFQKKKHKFEIICSPGGALAYRNGKLGINKVLQVDQVFTNTTKGDIANPDDLKQVFGTDNILDCCKLILEQGEIQYTPQERKQFIAEKTNEIIYYLNKNYVDPKTKLPHPSQRIEMALKKSKIVVDANADAKTQAENILKKISGKSLMFAKAVAMTAKLTFKHAYVNQCQNIIHSNATIINQDWVADGCVFTLELTQSGVDSLILKLNKPTNGNYDFSIVNDSINNNISSNDNKKSKTQQKLEDKLKYKEEKKKKRKEKKEKKAKKNKENKDKYNDNNDNNDNNNENEKKYNKKDKKKKKRKDKFSDLNELND